MKITLLVLAAGMGSRYGGLKQLDQVGPSGETIMDYSVYDAIRAGFDRVVFVIRKDFEAEFREKVLSRYEGKIETACAFQDLDDLPGNYQRPADRVKPWGTGHAVYAARNIVDGPFAVINADDLYGAESYRLLADALRNSKAGTPLDCCMAGYLMRNTLSENGTVSRGVCTEENGNLVSVVERTSLKREGDVVRDEEGNSYTGEELVSMNCWGFSAGLFPELERLFTEFLAARGTELKSEFYIPFVADQLIRENRATVKMLVSRATWFGVTYKEDKPLVTEGLKNLVDQGVYPANLFN